LVLPALRSILDQQRSTMNLAWYHPEGRSLEFVELINTRLPAMKQLQELALASNFKIPGSKTSEVIVLTAVKCLSLKVLKLDIGEYSEIVDGALASFVKNNCSLEYLHVRCPWIEEDTKDGD
jgi:hypothetical protein